MVFDFKAKEKRDFSPLTEDDIRNRLYGSAVGISADTFDRPQREKKDADRTVSPAPKDTSDDMSRIHDELADLRLELEQAKRRLKKIKGISVQRVRVVLIYILISFVVLFLLALVLKNSFSAKPQAQSAGDGVPASKISYTVQVAVSERLADAEKFKASLEAKGYRPFIRKSSFASGKDKFTIYAGEFSERESAIALMNSLRSEEGIKDSFVVNMPKQDKRV